jgi:tRNA A-37 threonylcarbamoyl transferase component Bud32
MAIEPGQRIGNYQIEQHIGSGAFATVWFARDVMLDAPVAVKVLADNWARDPEIHGRFIHEAKLLRRLDDDHVVQVFTVGELPDGRPFFVMAFADRGTLHDRIDARRAAGPWPLADALATTFDMLSCLEVVHDLGVVHRDLKPSNVLYRSLSEHVSRRLGRGERIVLGDFGLAKDLVRASGFTMAAGTPAYMAPEQTRSTTQLDHRADLYSATAILFELLVGRPPVDAATVSGRRRARWSADDLQLDQLAARLPGAVLDAIRRGLAENPVDRFSSAAEMRAVLAAALASAPPEQAVGDLAAAAPASELAAPSPVGDDLTRRLHTLAAAVPGAAGAALRNELSRPFTVAVVGGSPRAAALADSLAGELPDATVLAADREPAGPVDAAVVVVDPSPDAGAGDLATAVDGLRRDPVAPVVVVAAVADATEGSLAAYRDSNVAAAVADVFAVDDHAGVAALLGRAARRLDAIRASSALAVMPPAGQLGATVLDEVEVLRSSQPAVAEMQVLRDDATGRLPLPASLRSALRDALLPAAGSAHDADAGVGGDARQRIESQLSTWRNYQNSGRASFAARSAVDTVITTLERRWATS